MDDTQQPILDMTRIAHCPWFVIEFIAYSYASQLHGPFQE
jgi:hypothetical protein